MYLFWRPVDLSSLISYMRIGILLFFPLLSGTVILTTVEIASKEGFDLYIREHVYLRICFSLIWMLIIVQRGRVIDMLKSAISVTY
jgi:hypothetical protein